MKIALKHSRLGLRNSTTRIPFRYGVACLTRCPQATLEVTIQTERGLQTGYSADCLPPSWFDKSPERSYRQQIDDMLAIISLAEKTFLEEFASATTFFPAWMISYERVHQQASQWQFSPLLISFGISLLERAVIDAMARAAGLSFLQAVKEDLFRIAASEIHAQLPRDLKVADCLVDQPAKQVFVRHTVGLADPLTSSEIPHEERLNDGFPQALEEYIQQSGLRYFKIKLSNQLDHDLQRLKTIAALVERHRAGDYALTLDGNEQYKRADDLFELIESVESEEDLQTLWNNTLVIEQPLERSIALQPEHTEAIRRLSQKKAVIIDESDGSLDSYASAVQVGYRGVSSKNCKGPIKSLLNACLTWKFNEGGRRCDYVMTGEDLCSVGIIAMQADLCLAVALGLQHVERNGHHYHPGLSYLPAQQRDAALREHGDLYADHGGIVAQRLVDGRFEIGSLQCVGFGFSVEPDFDAFESPDQWTYDSLGLDD